MWSSFLLNVMQQIFMKFFFLIFRPVVDSAGIIKYILFVHYIFPSLAFVRNINFVAVSYF